MDSWIFQPGFPLVTARADGDQVTVTQERFGYGASPGAQRWDIPMRVRVHHATETTDRALLLDGEHATFEAPADALVVLDAGGEGFYRVSYPHEWRDRLLDAGVLSPLERFSLVDDLWAAVLADRAPAQAVLALARQLRGEDDLVVWRVLVGVLRSASRFVDGAALTRLRSEVSDIVAPTFARLGWEPAPGEDARTRQLRGLVLDVLGTLADDPAVIARARETDTDGATDPDVASACVAIVAGAGHAETFDEFVARVRAPRRRPRPSCDTCTRSGRFRPRSWSCAAARHAMSDAVRPQNGPFLIQRALRNREHGPTVWVFVRDNWDDVRARFSASLVPRLLDGITWLVDDTSAADVPRFLAEHPVPEGARVISQHLERQRVHRAAVDRERDRLSAALLDR